MVLFIFYNKLEVDWVFENVPWSFDWHLVAIERFERNTNIRKLAFNRVFFWGQIYNIPIKYMNQKVANDTCLGIGGVCKTDNSEGEGGDFRRVRVSIDISKSLCISLEDGGMIRSPSNMNVSWTFATGAAILHTPTRTVTFGSKAIVP